MTRTVESLIKQSAAMLDRAALCYGHGTDNAIDEAAELIFFALNLRHGDAPLVYARAVNADDEAVALALIRRRIEERRPAAYLTHRMWFCGHEFYVDERVLVPRSPIAELIESGFAPWIEPERIGAILDIGTGSGCIAIAAALTLPSARVDAADLSDDALAVARVNIERHQVAERVRPVKSDVFAGLEGGRYDVIVSNPPYVSAREVAELPHEYRHEPQMGLLAGDDGLSIVRRILSGAERHLTPQGVLIVEVGDTEAAVVAAYPRVPFTWLEFERGGGGVFLLTAEQVARHQEDLSAPHR